MDNTGPYKSQIKMYQSRCETLKKELNDLRQSPVKFTIESLRTGIDLEKHYNLKVQKEVFTTPNGLDWIETIIEIPNIQTLLELCSGLKERIIVGPVKGDTGLPTLTIYDAAE